MMSKRYMAIWFRYLTADRLIRRRPELKDVPFVQALPERGRMTVKAASASASAQGIRAGMVVADCRAVLPTLQVFDAHPGEAEKLLEALAGWCLRFTPIAAVDGPDGLILDISGCPHLWGGEAAYLKDITGRLKTLGYHIRAAIADTIGAAWAVSRYGSTTPIVMPGKTKEALMPLPPAALRADGAIVERLEKLGFMKIAQFIDMPRQALRRRFGRQLLNRLDQAMGAEMEMLEPVCPLQPFLERLPLLEPIRTAKAIEIAIKQLLDQLCSRLAREEKGLRKAVLHCYRIDGQVQEVVIGTNRASRNAAHLFKLFELKIPSIEPDLGIELFTLESAITEELTAAQEALFETHSNSDDAAIAGLLDRISGKLGPCIRRYLPAEHYWPERSYKLATSLAEEPETAWRTDLPRPLHLLPTPEPIEVTVALPDYPPMLFHYKGQLHQVVRADGPERIEQEWWLQEGLYRDYYCVEDKEGGRYWLFRAGPYDEGQPKWFLHGFFS